MITEDELRVALHGYADDVEPTPGSLGVIEARLSQPSSRDWRRLVVPLVAVAALVASVLAVPGVLRGDGARTIQTVDRPAGDVAPRLSERDAKEFAKSRPDFKNRPVYLVLSVSDPGGVTTVAATATDAGRVLLTSQGEYGYPGTWSPIDGDRLGVQQSGWGVGSLFVGTTDTDATTAVVSITGKATSGTSYNGEFRAPVISVPGTRTKVFAILARTGRVRVDAVRTSVLDRSGVTLAVSPGGSAVSDGFPRRLTEADAARLREMYPDMGDGPLFAVFEMNRPDGLARVIVRAIDEDEISLAVVGFGEANRIDHVTGRSLGWRVDRGDRDNLIVGSSDSAAALAVLSIEGLPTYSAPLVALPGTRLKVFALLVPDDPSGRPGVDGLGSAPIQLVDTLGTPPASKGSP
jgi:hypothetical protein